MAEREMAVAARLVERGETLAVVETSAGGLVSSRLTSLPGSSAWFVGGVVAYSAEARQVCLDLSPEAIRQAGAVSAESALALARAGRARLGTVWTAAETGIAGPQIGRRSGKPVGLAYVAVVGQRNGQICERVDEVATGFDDRSANREAFAAALLDLLIRCLDES